MKVTQHQAITAFVQGKERGLAGGAVSENPHEEYVRRQHNPLHTAWLRGHAAGLRVRDAA